VIVSDQTLKKLLLEGAIVIEPLEATLLLQSL